MKQSDIKAKLAQLRLRQTEEIKTGGKIDSGGRAYFDLASTDVKIYSPTEIKGKNSQKIEFEIIPFEINSENHPLAGNILDENESYLPGDFDYKLDFFIHKQVGPNNITILCPKYTFKNSLKWPEKEKRCPICEERGALLEAGANWDDKMIKAMKHKHRVVYNILVENEDGEQEIQLMDLAFNFMEELLLVEAEASGTIDDPICYSDLEIGSTIQCTATKTTFEKSKFWKYSNIRFIEREPLDISILHEVIALDTLLVIPTYEQIKKAYYDEDEEQEEEKPGVKRTGKVIKKTTRSVKTEVEEAPTPEIKRVVRERKSRKKIEEKVENLCPFNLNWGTDCNAEDDCQNCEEEVYQKCAVKYEELEASGTLTDDDIPF